MNKKRAADIVDFLKSLKINSVRFNQILEANHPEKLRIINEALTHSSMSKKNNHEKELMERITFEFPLIFNS